MSDTIDSINDASPMTDDMSDKINDFTDQICDLIDRINDMISGIVSDTIDGINHINYQ